MSAVRLHKETSPIQKPPAHRPWGRRFLLLWGLLVVIGMLTFIARIESPPKTLIELLDVSAGGACHMPEGQVNHGWWRVRLKFEPGNDSIAAWTLMTDAPLGYALSWNPKIAALRLIRQTGPGPTLLASLPMKDAPTTLEWRSRGDLQEFIVDGETRTMCLDLLPALPGRTWRLTGAGALGKTVMEVHDDNAEIRKNPDDFLDGLPDMGRKQASRQLAADIRKIAFQTLNPNVAPAQPKSPNSLDLDGARVKAEKLQPSEIRAQGVIWTLWSGMVGQARFAPETDCRDYLTVIDGLRLATSEKSQALIPGILLNVMEEYLARLERPYFLEGSGQTRRAPAWIRERTACCTIIAGLASSLSILSSDLQNQLLLSPEERWELILLNHAARRLSGLQTDPEPAEAPEWFLIRYRALAGTLPLRSEIPGDCLPNLPSDGAVLPVTRPLLDRMLRLTSLEPQANLGSRIRGRMLVEVAKKPTDLGLTEDDFFDSCVKEDRMVRLALLASASKLPRSRAQKLLLTLEQKDAKGQKLIEIDPLAHALWQLAAHRGEFRFSRRIPETLMQYDWLQQANPEELVFTPEQLRIGLPPSEILAATLAMQEVTTGHADWNLLSRLPSMTLPLELLIPER